MFSKKKNKPTISFIVICYDMEREVKRTLLSLTKEYQIDSQDIHYEVILVDNGSPTPFPSSYVERLGENFSYYYLPDASSSPAAAVNFGVGKARGDFVGIIIDGARVLSPGVVKWASYIFSLCENPVISIVGFHLGPGLQFESAKLGYDQELEDQMLEGIDWFHNGYDLFSIASLAGSSRAGWFGGLWESNCLFLRRDLYRKLGGFDERFVSPGGGLVNLDFYQRVVREESTRLFHVLGEGCFHQIHGGVTTGGGEKTYGFEDFQAEYRSIRGCDCSLPITQPTLIGSSPVESMHLIRAASDYVIGQQGSECVIDKMEAFIGRLPSPLKEGYQKK